MTTSSTDSSQPGADAAHDRQDDAAPPCEDFPLAARVEALLVATDRPLKVRAMAELLGIPSAGARASLTNVIEGLNRIYDEGERSFRIFELAGGWQIMTRPEYGALLDQFHRAHRQSRLSPAAMETLSIIAYRQPILRAEIEAIRGVTCGEVLRGLMERHLLKVTGRSEELGRPMLYGTTNEFLEIFGLARITDLPNVAGIDTAFSRAVSDQSKPGEQGEAEQAPEGEDVSGTTDAVEKDTGESA